MLMLNDESPLVSTRTIHSSTELKSSHMHSSDRDQVKLDGDQPPQRSAALAQFVEDHTNHFLLPFVLILLVLVPITANEILAASQGMWIFPITGCAITANDIRDTPPGSEFHLQNCFDDFNGATESMYEACLGEDMFFDVRGLPFQEFFTIASAKTATATVATFMMISVIVIFTFYALMMRRLWKLRNRALELLKYRVYYSMHRRPYYIMLGIGVAATIVYVFVKVFILRLYQDARVSLDCAPAGSGQQAWIVLDMPAASDWKWAIDLVIAFIAFNSPLQLLASRLQDFYRDLPLKDLICQQTPQLVKDLGNMYILDSRDLDSVMVHYGHRKEGLLIGFSYGLGEVIGALPDLVKNGSLRSLNRGETA